MSQVLTRRGFVARAALGAAAGIAGCKSSTDSTDPQPGTLDHVVVVTMENRSFDHLLGWLPGADGKQSDLTYLDVAGQPHQPQHITAFNSCGLADPNHSYEGGRSEYNSGACDGWLRTPGNDAYAIGYHEAADLPFLGKAAPEWTVLDRYFAPIMGPTFPNRIISQAGQTDRLSNTQIASTLSTIWDRLASAGLTGRNYGGLLTSASLFGGRYSALIRPISDFFSDASGGTLPNVAYVDPDLMRDYSDSYHPPGDIRNAEAFLGRIYGAVTSSPNWSSTLLIITFDEWGGFFDHVPPPVAPIPQIEKDIGHLDGLRGFRVPTILISPFVRRRHVSSVVYDHASILRLIESRWGLQPLAVRDEQANNLMAELDLSTRVNAPAIDVADGPGGAACP